MNQELTLRNRLEQISGVSIRGRYENTKVYIRGERSFQANRGKQPLFVVDGRKMGRSFYRIASIFTPEQIVSVEVLSGAGANLYGSEGGAGVIVIKTNRGN
ncbi:MAG TPA: TonB-dependent receptor plug domain-containing protein [Balneolaceae bacterium]